MGRARLRRNPEHFLGPVGVPIFGLVRVFLEELEMELLESVRDVLQKNETEDDMLVLGCVDLTS